MTIGSFRWARMMFIGLAITSLKAAPDQQPSPRLSYAIGVEITKPLLKESIALDKEAFLQGIYDSLSGQPLKMSAEEIHVEISTYMDEIIQRREREIRMVAEFNQEEGDKFLAVHRKEKGVVALPSGIQYKILASSGLKKHPGPKDLVTTHYRGTLINGTEFDSSYNRGEPVQFSLEQVIPGWTEVLQLMSPGDKWQVVIPAELAFGRHAPSTVIGPNKTLIFDIELIDYEASQKA
ncbi:MAG: FKBP-type peptidyl-prolyl cis-trans isomerase [Gammaproteobacteria bacterium]|nr:FKBP-type peptidyl-prolyl cis-trans isomerase [Gammaproteobacteria bacterium]